MSRDASKELETYRSDHRAAQERDHRPVESDRVHSKARSAEKSVDSNIIRRNPANPSERAECCEEESRDEVPHERRRRNDVKELLAGHVATIALAEGFVEGVEQCSINDGSRPQHAGGIDYPLAYGTGQAKAVSLDAEDKEYLVCDPRILLVEVSLSDGDICSIASRECDVRHDLSAKLAVVTMELSRTTHGNGNMLLHVERPWVKTTFVPKDVELARRQELLHSLAHRERNKLNDETRDCCGRICTVMSFSYVAEM